MNKFSSEQKKLLFFFGTSDSTPFKNQPQPQGMNIVVHPEVEDIKGKYSNCLLKPT